MKLSSMLSYLNYRWCYLLFRLTILHILLHGIVVTTYAQGITWTPPVKYFEVEPGGDVQSPILVSDGGGRLHAFWSAKVNASAPTALYHSYWLDDQWSEPIDVLLSTFPTKIVAGNDNHIHAFWHFNRQLYYSKAHVSKPGDARNWTMPRVLSSINDGNFSVTQDPHGKWYLTYAEEGLAAIKILRSDDNWNSFDQVTSITNEDPAIWLAFPNIAVAADGSLWLAWNEVASDWQANSNRTETVERAGRRQRLVGTRSLDDGDTWTEPQVLIEGYYNGGYLSVGDILIRLAAGGIGTGGRFVSFSYDSGNTWTEPRNIGLGEGEGMQSIGLVVDSRNEWHFLVETGSTFAEVPWQAGIWGTPQLVVSRELIQECCITPGEVTENGSIGISNGNRLHVIFEQANLTLWWSQKALDAPSVSTTILQPSVDFQVATPEHTERELPVALEPEPRRSIPAGERVRPSDLESELNHSLAAPWYPIVAGSLSALLIVVMGAVLARVRARNGR